MSIDLTPLILEVDRRHETYVLSDPNNQPRQPDNPWASSIGECAREGFHAIVDWEARPRPSVELYDRFEMGREVERLVMMRLIREGWAITHQQVKFKIVEQHNGSPLLICSGKYEGRIGWGRAQIIYEVKSLHPNVFHRVNSLGDFKSMGSFWTKYVAQMLLYLYSQSEDAGVFILADCLGHLKLIPVVLGEWLDDCEKALRASKATAIGVATKTPPPYHKNPAVCMKCWARDAGVCTPPLDFSGAGIRVVDDPEIVEAIRTMEIHDAAATEYYAAKKIVDARFKASGAGEYMVGDYIVTTKESVSVSYKVPDELKAPYAVEGKRVTTRWERAGSKGVE